jgi:hypothetical protein
MNGSMAAVEGLENFATDYRKYLFFRAMHDILVQTDESIQGDAPVW